MPKFQPQFAPAQRLAVERCVIDADQTAPVAVALAAAGELLTENGERLEPFDVKVSTVQRWAREERNRRVGIGATELAKAERPMAAKAIVNRTLDVLESELRIIEHQRAGIGQNAERKTAHRIATAERIATAAEKILRLERAISEKPAPATPKEPKRGPRDPEATALEREAKQRHAEQNGAIPSVPPTESGVLHAAQRDASLRSEGQGNGASPFSPSARDEARAKRE